jgi:oxygen-independent coproporphyrinogen-3 oxidase
MTAPLVFDAELIRRYDRAGPRYTSYPTALQFSDDFRAAEFCAAARVSNDGAAAKPLSLYIHIPFCASPCFYCACTRVITRNTELGDRYLDHLRLEIDRVSELFDRARVVDQVHFGGGTPTFLSTEQLASIVGHLDRRFSLQRGADREFAIEIDPRTVDESRLNGLLGLGFNRLSLGIQDFDPRVQTAVNRVQSQAHTLRLIEVAKRAGLRSLNVDLIYGLPLQTLESFAGTLRAVNEARPDRIAVYSYAHLPARFKAQRQIARHQLPSAAEKLELFRLTVETLTAAGYLYVGMDHFALPDDELVRAQKDGSLQRNFQGYSTRAACDLIGLGMSSISRIGDTYSQNFRTLAGYSAAIDRGDLATERGVRLGHDDLLRREVIQSLMCDLAVDFAAVERSHGIDFERYFGSELNALIPLQADGLVERRGRSLCVTGRGQLLMRNIAMVFDAYLAAPSEQAAARYSRSI